jgi:hypothetical protein
MLLSKFTIASNYLHYHCYVESKLNFAKLEHKESVATFLHKKFFFTFFGNIAD